MTTGSKRVSHRSGGWRHTLADGREAGSYKDLEGNGHEAQRLQAL